MTQSAAAAASRVTARARWVRAIWGSAVVSMAPTGGARMRTSVSREHGEREDDLIQKLGRKHAPDKQVVAEDYSHAAGAEGAHMLTRSQLKLCREKRTATGTFTPRCTRYAAQAYGTRPATPSYRPTMCGMRMHADELTRELTRARNLLPPGQAQDAQASVYACRGQDCPRKPRRVPQSASAARRCPHQREHDAQGGHPQQQGPRECDERREYAAPLHDPWRVCQGPAQCIRDSRLIAQRKTRHAHWHISPCSCSQTGP